MALIMIDQTFIDFDKVKKYELSYGDRRGTYHGQTKDGIPNGSGILELKNKQKVPYLYRGDFVEGHFEGEGKILWNYQGEYKYEVGTYKNDEIVPIKLDEDTQYLFWEARIYTHHCIEFTGVVDEKSEYREEFTEFKVMCDIENKADALILRVYDPEFNAEAGDYIRAVGVVETYFSETNINEEESTSIVAAYEYDEISYEEAVSPELIKKDPDKKYLRPIYYMK